jgi:hypothetical protein
LSIGLCVLALYLFQGVHAGKPFPGQKSLFEGKFEMFKGGRNIVVVPLLLSRNVVS